MRGADRAKPTPEIAARFIRCSFVEVNNETTETEPVSLPVARRRAIAGVRGPARQHGAPDRGPSLPTRRGPAHLDENRPERRRQNQPRRTERRRSPPAEPLRRGRPGPRRLVEPARTRSAAVERLSPLS